MRVIMRCAVAVLVVATAGAAIALESACFLMVGRQMSGRLRVTRRG